MQINYSDQIVLKNKKSIFLAGPTPRTFGIISWRREAVKILEELEFEGIVYVPEKEHEDGSFDYLNQVSWERDALHSADVIVFWIPREFPNMLALTTNVEFGYYVSKRTSNILYGRPDESIRNRYLDWLYELETDNKPISNLKELLMEAIGRV